MLLSPPQETPVWTTLLSHAVAAPTPPQLISSKQMLDLGHQDLSWSLQHPKEVGTPSCKALKTLNSSQQNSDLCASPARKEFVWTSACSAFAPSPLRPLPWWEQFLVRQFLRA